MVTKTTPTAKLGLLSIINDARSFPSGAGRYEVFFEGDCSGTIDSFDGAVAEANALLRERASKVSVFDHVRGYAVASGRA